MKFEVRCDRENTAGLPLIALAQFFVYLSYNSIITFVLVTLIFFVLAEFDNVTPAYRT